MMRILLVTIIISLIFTACPTGLPLPEKQTPVAEDFTVDNLNQITINNITPVTITPKKGKSTGKITVYYDGSTTFPTVEGLYSVTFDVAETTDWKEVKGLIGGNLNIHATHIPSDWEYHTAPACTEAATEKKLCTICGLLLETKFVGEPLGHDYVWRIINEPHVGRDGVEAQVCTRDQSHISGEPQRTYKSVIVNPPAYEHGKIETVGAVGNTTKTFSSYGTDVPFTATVEGENNPLQTVNWSIIGTNLSGGTIINNGLLTIDAADYGKEITVTAVSSVDVTKKGATSVTAVQYLPSALSGKWNNNGQTLTVSYYQNEDTKIFYYQIRLNSLNGSYYELFTLTWEYVFSTGANNSGFPEGYKVNSRQANGGCGVCENPECNIPWVQCNNSISCFCYLDMRIYIFINTANNTLRFSGNGNLENTYDFTKMGS